MGGAVGIVILVAVIAVPLLLWQIVNPRAMWKATESWKYRHPEANEPSDAALGLSSIGAVIALIGLVVGIGMVINMQSDVDSDRRDREASRTTATYPYPYPSTPSPPDWRDLGAGTVIGYVYPSALTMRFVVLGGEPSTPVAGGCATRVSVYEQTNAIVVGVSRRQTASYFDNTFSACQPVKPEVVVTQQLRTPIGDRPILTAAPVAEPAQWGLAYGPPVRPQPLAENPRPGVVQPLRPVRIDPSWKPVPLLATLPSRLPR